MSDSTICLKPISALLANTDGSPANYWIPAYQRGYRWSPLQVTQLLDDVWEFIQASEGGDRRQFYCLQPLVIKVLPDGVFEVVDGQQRLTTIFIILTYLKEMAAMLGKVRFRLTFATRGKANEPFLETIDLNREKENVDFFHICQAYRAIEGWFQNRDPMHKLKLLQHLLNDDEAGRNVKVIWFQLADGDNQVDAFTRLNVGKIPLTNDELIRALFLGRGRKDQIADDSAKVRIAYEWDIIEKSLQDDTFWYFLTDRKWDQNRIGFLFELIAKANGIPPEAEHDEYKVFYSFNKKLSEPGTTPEREWLKIKQEFMRLQEWFDDPRRISYHIIGFLVTQSVGLDEIRELAKECTKSQFDRRLRDRAYRSVMGAPTVPPEEELRVKLTANLEGLEYVRDSKKLRSILLLFNIATLLQSKRSNVRFQFDAFNDGSLGWDLEHIRSSATDKVTDRTAWLNDCLRFLETQSNSGELLQKIQGYLAPCDTPATDEQFDTLHSDILKYFGELEDQEEWNDLGNLTLLDSGTNRSYKNAPFAVKRQKILSLDQSGIFVPLCTRNVFLKCYSNPPGNPIYWTYEDGEAYQHAVIETLTNFFIAREVA